MASEIEGGDFGKKRKNSKKFHISLFKDVISRNKKTPVDKKCPSSGGKGKQKSNSFNSSSGSNFCATPLCVDISGFKTDHSTSPPFSPSILGTKQIFTFDDLFPHIRKSPAKIPANSGCSSLNDHGVYSDSYDIPHDAQLFQQPFYQPIKLATNSNQHFPRTFQPLENFPSSHSTSHERFVPEFVSSMSTSAGGTASGSRPPASAEGTFSNNENSQLPSIKNSEMSLSPIPRQLVNRVSEEAYYNLGDEIDAWRQDALSRLHSLNANHLAYSQGGVEPSALFLHG